LPDERGFFAEVLRQDWKELIEDEWIRQVNVGYSYPNIIQTEINGPKRRPESRQTMGLAPPTA